MSAPKVLRMAYELPQGPPMKIMTAVEAQNSFVSLWRLHCVRRAVMENRREVAAMFSMEDIRSLADSCLAAPP